MSVHIVLNSPPPAYTNLDIIPGTIILAIGREESFQTITVKLECESRTRLYAPRFDGRLESRRQDVQFELHKLLYKTQVVFPTPELVQSVAGVRGAVFVLPPGEHRFPFQFKFPFNNACVQPNSVLLMAQDFNRHVKKTLPPNLTGFPGEGEIRYFVKVTAQRSGMFKENYRHEVDIRFLPMEPPREPPNRREAFARRQHQFSPALDAISRPGMFRRQSMTTSGPPPRINIDGRLPDPAVITLNERIPLRILVKKLNETPEIIFVKNFHIVLVGFTKLKARGLERVEQNTWVIASHANLQIPLGTSQTPVDKDMEVDNSMWIHEILPSSIAPTFETCNLVRWYELRVDVGLGWGTPGNIKPELSVQSLRMPVDVYSGIKPPPQLVEEMSSRPPLSTIQQHSSPNFSSPMTPQATGHHPLSSPQNQARPQSFQGIPISLQQPDRPHDPEAGIDDPPPSYEDAVAEGLPPVDGQRAGNVDGAGQQGGNNGSKGERLFGSS